MIVTGIAVVRLVRNTFPKYLAAARMVVASAGLIETEIPALKEQIGSLNKEVTSLHSALSGYANRKDSTQRLEQDSSPLEQSSSPPSIKPAAVFGLLDRVGLYQKNGVVEQYGLTLRQRQAAPISINYSSVNVEADDAWLVWLPDFSPASPATTLRVRMRGLLPQSGNLSFGIVTSTGKIYIFQITHNVKSPPAAHSPSVKLPPNLAISPEAQTVKINLVDVGDGSFISELPNELQQEFRKTDRAINSWFIAANGMKGTTVEFRDIELLGGLPGARDDDTVLVHGRIVGGTPEPGSVVRLLRENGSEITSTVSADGSFRFKRVPAGLVSIRYRHDLYDYESTLGRWFEAAADRDVTISLVPRYVNTDGHNADLSLNKATFTSSPNEYLAYQQPHTLRRHVGFQKKPQEYDTITFANNFGYSDRDRFFDNPDHCIRVVVLGASDVQAVQVPLFQKFSMIVESDLAIRLGVCVEAITAGNDGAEIGEEWMRINKYAIPFKPDYILLANQHFLMLRLQPQLLRQVFGVDAEHNQFDGFYYKSDGNLAFRPADPTWGLYSTDKLNTEMAAPGVPFFYSLWMPFDDMHPWARQAFDLTRDIVKYFQKAFPDTRFGLFSAYDQMRADYPVEHDVVLSNGKRSKYGLEILLANITAMCASSGLDCITPSIPEERYRSVGNPKLTGVWDLHPSPLGHQWEASELVAALSTRLRSAAELKKGLRTTNAQ